MSLADRCLTRGTDEKAGVRQLILAREIFRGAVVRIRSGSGGVLRASGAGHQAQRAPCVSRNSPVSVNVAASICARIASAASAGEVGALGPPIAVRTQPGWTTIDRIWSSRSSKAIERAIMLSAALDTRYARWSGALVLLIEPSTDEMYASFLPVPRRRWGSSAWLTRSAPSALTSNVRVAAS